MDAGVSKKGQDGRLVVRVREQSSCEATGARRGEEEEVGVWSSCSRIVISDGWASLGSQHYTRNTTAVLKLNWKSSQSQCSKHATPNHVGRPAAGQEAFRHLP